MAHRRPRAVEVLERQTLSGAAGLAGTLPAGLADAFTTADVALGLGIDRALAQRIAYTLRVAGVIELSGRRGRALEYCRSRCVPVTHRRSFAICRHGRQPRTRSSEDDPSVINRTATTVHQYLVGLWLAGLAVTVFLAGARRVRGDRRTSKLGDDNSTKLVSADDLDPHRHRRVAARARHAARPDRRRLGPHVATADRHVDSVLRARASFRCCSPDSAPTTAPRSAASTC